jgi:hypothetical protein
MLSFCLSDELSSIIGQSPKDDPAQFALFPEIYILLDLEKKVVSKLQQFHLAFINTSKTFKEKSISYLVVITVSSLCLVIHSDFNQIWTISDIPRGTEITIDCCAGRGFLSLRGKDSRKEYISRNILGEQFSCVCDFCQEPDEDQTIERLILGISKLQKEY